MTEHDDNFHWRLAGTLANIALLKAKAKPAQRVSTFDMERFMSDFFQYKRAMCLTDLQIAERMLVSQAVISKVKRRESNPGASLLLKMAEFAQLDLRNYRGERT